MGCCRKRSRRIGRSSSSVEARIWLGRGEAIRQVRQPCSPWKRRRRRRRRHEGRRNRRESRASRRRRSGGDDVALDAERRAEASALRGHEAMAGGVLPRIERSTKRDRDHSCLSWMHNLMGEHHMAAVCLEPIIRHEDELERRRPGCRASVLHLPALREELTGREHDNQIIITIGAKQFHFQAIVMIMVMMRIVMMMQQKGRQVGSAIGCDDMLANLEQRMGRVMELLALTRGTQVEVATDRALEADADDGAGVAEVAIHMRVNRGSGLLRHRELDQGMRMSHPALTCLTQIEVGAHRALEASTDNRTGIAAIARDVIMNSRLDEEKGRRSKGRSKNKIKKRITTRRKEMMSWAEEARDEEARAKARERNTKRE